MSQVEELAGTFVARACAGMRSVVYAQLAQLHVLQEAIRSNVTGARGWADTPGFCCSAVLWRSIGLRR